MRGSIGGSHTRGGQGAIDGGSSSAVASGVGIYEREYHGDQLDFPVNTDTAVGEMATAEADPLNESLTVRAFDDTTEEGVMWRTRTHSGVSTLYFRVVGRARTAPVAARKVGLKLYARKIVPVGAWQSIDMGDFDIEANTDFREQVFTVAFTDFGTPLEADTEYQYELTRVNPSAGTDLTGDFLLEKLGLRYA